MFANANLRVNSFPIARPTVLSGKAAASDSFRPTKIPVNYRCKSVTQVSLQCPTTFIWTPKAFIRSFSLSGFLALIFILLVFLESSTSQWRGNTSTNETNRSIFKYCAVHVPVLATSDSRASESPLLTNFIAAGEAPRMGFGNGQRQVSADNDVPFLHSTNNATNQTSNRSSTLSFVGSVTHSIGVRDGASQTVSLRTSRSQTKFRPDSSTHSRTRAFTTSQTVQAIRTRTSSGSASHVLTQSEMRLPSRSGTFSSSVRGLTHTRTFEEIQSATTSLTIDRSSSRTVGPTTQSATTTVSVSITDSKVPVRTITHQASRTVTHQVCSRQDLMPILTSFPFNWYRAGHPLTTTASSSSGGSVTSMYPIHFTLTETDVREGTAINPFSENYWRRLRESSEHWTSDDVRWSSPYPVHGFWEQLTTKAPSTGGGGGVRPTLRPRPFSRGFERQQLASDNQKHTGTQREKEVKGDRREKQLAPAGLTPREEIDQFLQKIHQEGRDRTERKSAQQFPNAESIIDHHSRIITRGSNARRGEGPVNDGDDSAYLSTGNLSYTDGTLLREDRQRLRVSSPARSRKSAHFHSAQDLIIVTTPAAPFNKTNFWVLTPYPIIMDIVKPGDHIPLTGYFTPTHATSSTQQSPFGFEKIIQRRQRIPQTRAEILARWFAAGSSRSSSTAETLTGFPMVGIAINWTHMAVVMEPIPEYAIGIDEFIEIHLDLRYLGYCGSGVPSFTSANGGVGSSGVALLMRGENTFHLATLHIVVDTRNIEKELNVAKGVVGATGALTALGAADAQPLPALALMRCGSAKMQMVAKYRALSPLTPFVDEDVEDEGIRRSILGSQRSGTTTGGGAHYLSDRTSGEGGAGEDGTGFEPPNWLGFRGGGGAIGALAGLGILIGGVLTLQIISVIIVRIYVCCRPLTKEQKKSLHLKGKIELAPTPQTTVTPLPTAASPSASTAVSCSPPAAVADDSGTQMFMNLIEAEAETDRAHISAATAPLLADEDRHKAVHSDANGVGSDEPLAQYVPPAPLLEHSGMPEDNGNSASLLPVVAIDVAAALRKRKQRGDNDRSHSSSSTSSTYYTSTSEDEYSLERLREAPSIGAFRRRAHPRLHTRQRRRGDNPDRLNPTIEVSAEREEDGEEAQRQAELVSGGLKSTSSHWNAEETDLAPSSPIKTALSVRDVRAKLFARNSLLAARKMGFASVKNGHQTQFTKEGTSAALMSSAALFDLASGMHVDTTDEESDIEDVDKWEARQQEKVMERLGLDPALLTLTRPRKVLFIPTLDDIGDEPPPRRFLPPPLQEGEEHNRKSDEFHESGTVPYCPSVVDAANELSDPTTRNEEESNSLPPPALSNAKEEKEEDDVDVVGVDLEAIRRREAMQELMDAIRAKAAERKRRLLERRANQQLTGSSRSPFVKGDMEAGEIREDLEDIPFDVYQHALVKTFNYNSWIGACATCYFPALTIYVIDACMLGLLLISVQLLQGPGEAFTSVSDAGLFASFDTRDAERTAGAVTIMLCFVYAVIVHVAVPSLLLRRSYLPAIYPKSIKRIAFDDEPLTEDELVEEEMRAVQQRRSERRNRGSSVGRPDEEDDVGGSAEERKRRRPRREKKEEVRKDSERTETNGSEQNRVGGAGNGGARHEIDHAGVEAKVSNVSPEDLQRSLPFAAKCPRWVQWLFFPKGIVMPVETRKAFSPLVSPYSRQHPVWATVPLWSPVTLTLFGSFPLRDNVGGCVVLFAFMALMHFLFAIVIMTLGPFRHRSVNLLTSVNFFLTGVLVCIASTMTITEDGEYSNDLLMGALVLSIIQIIFGVLRLLCFAVPAIFFTRVMENAWLKVEWIYLAPYADIKSEAKKVSGAVSSAAKSVGHSFSEIADEIAMMCESSEDEKESIAATGEMRGINSQNLSKNAQAAAYANDDDDLPHVGKPAEAQNNNSLADADDVLDTSDSRTKESAQDEPSDEQNLTTKSSSHDDNDAAGQLAVATNVVPKNDSLTLYLANAFNENDIADYLHYQRHRDSAVEGSYLLDGEEQQRGGGGGRASSYLLLSSPFMEAEMKETVEEEGATNEDNAVRESEVKGLRLKSLEKGSKAEQSGHAKDDPAELIGGNNVDDNDDDALLGSPKKPQPHLLTVNTAEDNPLLTSNSRRQDGKGRKKKEMSRSDEKRKSRKESAGNSKKESVQQHQQPTDRAVASVERDNSSIIALDGELGLVSAPRAPPSEARSREGNSEGKRERLGKKSRGVSIKIGDQVVRPDGPYEDDNAHSYKNAVECTDSSQESKSKETARGGNDFPTKATRGREQKNEANEERGTPSYQDRKFNERGLSSSGNTMYLGDHSFIRVCESEGEDEENEEAAKGDGCRVPTAGSEHIQTEDLPASSASEGTREESINSRRGVAGAGSGASPTKREAEISDTNVLTNASALFTTAANEALLLGAAYPSLLTFSPLLKSEGNKEQTLAHVSPALVGPREMNEKSEKDKQIPPSNPAELDDDL